MQILVIDHLFLDMTILCSILNGPYKQKSIKDTINSAYHGTILLKNGEISLQNTI